MQNDSPVFLIGYRKGLYQSVYEYDLPIVNPSPKVYDFVEPQNSSHDNPWKESFRTMVRLQILNHKCASLFLICVKNNSVYCKKL